MRKTDEPTTYGMVAEFQDPEELVIAAHKAREAGYKRMDAYSPFPVHGLAEAIGFNDIKMPWIVFLGGVFGCFVGFGLQTYVNVWDYPMNVGGRPLVPWISWFPVGFECTVLAAAFAAVFGMLGLNGLPRPHHPIFNAEHFDSASQDRFFLCIEYRDPKFDLSKTGDFLRSLGAVHVSEVAA